MSTSRTASRHHGHNGQAMALGEELDELKETVKTGLHDTSERGRRVVHAAGAAASDVAAGLRDSAVQTRDRVAKTIADRPLTAVAIAAGVGAIAATYLLWRRR